MQDAGTELFQLLSNASKFEPPVAEILNPLFVFSEY